MNNERRKAIAALADRTQNLLGRVADLHTEAEDIASDIESVMEEEQDYFDNMAESLQGGEKGCAAEDAVSALESAKDAIAAVLSEAETELEQAIDELESAQA